MDITGKMRAGTPRRAVRHPRTYRQFAAAPASLEVDGCQIPFGCGGQATAGFYSRTPFTAPSGRRETDDFEGGCEWLHHGVPSVRHGFWMLILMEAL
jgi:hypothetical protein